MATFNGCIRRVSGPQIQSNGASLETNRNHFKLSNYEHRVFIVFAVRATRSHKCFSITTHYTLDQVVCETESMRYCVAAAAERYWEKNNSKRLVKLQEPDVVIHGL